MKQHLNPFIKQSVLILAVALLASACQPSSPKLTPQEQERMSKLTETMTPRCMGRYLIDLPVDMKLSENRGTLIDNEVWIEVDPMAKLNFELRLRKRESEIKTEHRDGRPDQPSLWPNWKYPDPLPGQKILKTKGTQQGTMPFEEAFWGKGKAGLAPSDVEGFIVALPIQWTARENNNSGMNLSLLAENGALDSATPTGTNAKA